MGEDHKTLLRIHQMIVLLTLRYGETAYGSASKSALKTIEPIQYKGVKMFAICKTENALCETGLPTITEITQHNNGGNENPHK
jgi:hypothetical protein